MGLGLPVVLLPREPQIEREARDSRRRLLVGRRLPERRTVPAPDRGARRGLCR